MKRILTLALILTMSLGIVALAGKPTGLPEQGEFFPVNFVTAPFATIELTWDGTFYAGTVTGGLELESAYLYNGNTNLWGIDVDLDTLVLAFDLSNLDLGKSLIGQGGSWSVVFGTGKYESLSISGNFLITEFTYLSNLTIFLMKSNEILIPLEGLGHVKWTFGPDFQVVESDAGVYDGDEAIVQFPWEMNYYDWWLSARGKPGKIEVNDILADGHTLSLRSTGQPTWTVWPSGPYSWTGPVNGHIASLLNDGVTNLALRVYPNQVP